MIYPDVIETHKVQRAHIYYISVYSRNVDKQLFAVLGVIKTYFKYVISGIASGCEPHSHM